MRYFRTRQGTKDCLKLTGLKNRRSNALNKFVILSFCVAVNMGGVITQDKSYSYTKEDFEKARNPEESEFLQWYQDIANRMKLNPNPDEPKHFYNYREFYKAMQEGKADLKYDAQSGQMHFPSQFKTPGHPTFFAGGQNDYIKKLFASVETSGDTTGDWLQLEPSTYKTLLDTWYLDPKFSNINLEEVKKNTGLYDEVASSYLNFLMKYYGIPTIEDAVLWSYRPNYYMQYGGDIESIPENKKGSFGKSAKEVMLQRKNILDKLKRGTNAQR